MKNELLITEIKHECDDFANKVMDMFEGVRRGKNERNINNNNNNIAIYNGDCIHNAIKR
tara:strand:- start:1655 stop:1831 length:177 start_codon:yes stop_codon:yes gene_type:complete